MAWKGSPCSQIPQIFLTFSLKHAQNWGTQWPSCLTPHAPALPRAREPQSRDKWNPREHLGTSGPQFTSSPHLFPRPTPTPARPSGSHHETGGARASSRSAPGCPPAAPPPASPGLLGTWPQASSGREQGGTRVCVHACVGGPGRSRGHCQGLGGVLTLQPPAQSAPPAPGLGPWASGSHGQGQLHPWVLPWDASSPVPLSEPARL